MFSLGLDQNILNVFSENFSELIESHLGALETRSINQSSEFFVNSILRKTRCFGDFTVLAMTCVDTHV